MDVLGGAIAIWMIWAGMAPVSFGYMIGRIIKGARLAREED